MHVHQICKLFAPGQEGVSDAARVGPGSSQKEEIKNEKRPGLSGRPPCKGVAIVIKCLGD